MKLHWGLTLITFVAFIGLNPVISMVHEYGHAYVCAGNGYNYIIQPSITGTYFACDKFTGPGADQLRLQMYLYGGLFASATAFLLFVILFRVGLFKGKVKGVGYALVTIGTMQAVQMVLETFAHDLYMNSKFTIPVMSMLSLMMLITLLSRGSKPLLEATPQFKKNTKYREEIPENIFKRNIGDIIKGNKPLKKPKYNHDVTFASLDTMPDERDD